MNLKVTKIISLITTLIILVYSIIPSLSYAVEAGKPELKITTNKTNIRRGEELTATINLNTNNNPNVSSLQIELNYDKDVFSAKEITQGINDGGIYMDNIDTEGVVNVAYTSFNGNITYNGSVCQIVFVAKQNATIGSTDFKIVTDGETYPVQDSINNEPVDSTITNASVNVILPLESLTLTAESNELWVGDTTQLSVTYNPADTNEKDITYSSSSDAIAKVSNEGVVTAMGAGTATITAKGSNNVTATTSIKVKQPITGIKLSKSSLELEKGTSEKLTATVLPSNAEGDKTVTWESDKTSVATVEQDGTVKAVGKGSVNITATTSNGKTATCKVTVGVPLKSISFKNTSTGENNITEKTLNKSEQFTLEVEFNPADTDADKTIEWSSTDTSVATVNDGVIKAVGKGDTTIKATASNGKTATCTIHVKVPLNSISIKSETSIQYGQTEKLEVIYDPADTTDDMTISWSSNKEDVASVSTDGTVTAKAVGEATITAKTSNGKTATCQVTVLAVPLNSISIKEQNIVLNKNQTKELTVLYNPENTSDDKTVAWTSSNNEVVSVSPDGVITALKSGETVTITATVGDKTATTKVDVKVPLESISLNETEKNVNKGDNFQLTVTYNPEDTTDSKDVTWTSTDDSVAEVDEQGNVTAKKAGTAYIKAKVGDKEVSCKVNVSVPLTGIEINKETSELLKGQTDELTAKLMPEDTTYTGKINWSSEDETIATVDENGVVRALKEGIVIITAKATDGENEFTDSCTFTIKEMPLDSIEIDTSDFDLEIGSTKQLNIICNPENTTEDINIEWVSSNPDIVSVDENGLVRAISEGTAIITAKVGDKIATVVITSTVVPITSISLEGTDTKVLLGNAVNVNAIVNPSNATYDMKDLKFVSSNSDILYVNEDGTIIAKGVGKAILTVEAPNGVKSQIEIEVVNTTDELIVGDGLLDSAQGLQAGMTGVDAKGNYNSPKTGDTAIEVFITLMIISGLGIVVIVNRKLKENRK